MKISNAGLVVSTAFETKLGPVQYGQIFRDGGQLLDDASARFYRSIYHANFFRQIYPSTFRPAARSTFRQVLPSGEGEWLTLPGIDGFAAKQVSRSLFMFGDSLGLVSTHFELDSVPEDSLVRGLLRLFHIDTAVELSGNKSTFRELFESLLRDRFRDFTLIESCKAFVNLRVAPEEATISRAQDMAYRVANFILPEAAHNEVTEAYRQAQFERGGISIYQNWFALCVNDAFVRVGWDEDLFCRWERDYLSIFLHACLVREYLHAMNEVLANVTDLRGQIISKRAEFVEFMNDAQFHDVSTKFLPNQLFHSISGALELPEEMAIVEKKLSRVSSFVQDRRDRMLNTTLIAITFLSVFSVFLDLSLWLEKLGFGAWIWPGGSLILSAAILGVIIIYFLFQIRR